MWSACFQYFSNNWPLSFEELDPPLTPNPHSSHNTSNFVLLCISSYFFSLDEISSFHHKFLFCFALGFSLSLLTVAVSWYTDFSAPDYMGINSQNPTTNISCYVTLIFFLWYSHPASSFCGPMNICPPPPFFLKILLNVACSEIDG